MREKREEKTGLSIVFGENCDAKQATEKLTKASMGVFLIRESSINGLISISIRRDSPDKKTQVLHWRFAIKPGNDGKLGWVNVSGNAVEAKKVAEAAKNAFAHLADHPESIDSLIAMLKKVNVDPTKIITPENKKESSNSYSGYTADSYHSSVNIDLPKTHGYGGE